MLPMQISTQQLRLAFLVVCLCVSSSRRRGEFSLSAMEALAETYVGEALRGAADASGKRPHTGSSPPLLFVARVTGPELVDARVLRIAWFSILRASHSASDVRSESCAAPTSERNCVVVSVHPSPTSDIAQDMSYAVAVTSPHCPVRSTQAQNSVLPRIGFTGVP